MPDRDPPRLVVTDTDADLERRRLEDERKRALRDREWAERDVDWALRQLAANLIRVVRGAGKPYEIADHAQGFIQALVKYRDTVGTLDVMDMFPNMLSFGQHEPYRKGLEGPYLKEVRAEDRAIRGALQVAASRLLGQNTQQTAGRDELSVGARRLIEAYAEQSAEWDRKAREAAAVARAAKPKKPVRAAKPKRPA